MTDASPALIDWHSFVATPAPRGLVGCGDRDGGHVVSSKYCEHVSDDQKQDCAE